MKCPVCYLEMHEECFDGKDSMWWCDIHKSFNHKWVKGFWAGWEAHKADASSLCELSAEPMQPTEKPGKLLGFAQEIFIKSRQRQNINLV